MLPYRSAQSISRNQRWQSIKICNWLLIYLDAGNGPLRNYAEQNFAPEANRQSSGEEVSRIFWNQEVYCCVHKNVTLAPSLSI